MNVTCHGCDKKHNVNILNKYITIFVGNGGLTGLLFISCFGNPVNNSSFLQFTAPVQIFFSWSSFCLAIALFLCISGCPHCSQHFSDFIFFFPSALPSCTGPFCFFGGTCDRFLFNCSIPSVLGVLNIFQCAVMFPLKVNWQSPVVDLLFLASCLSQPYPLLSAGMEGIYGVIRCSWGSFVITFCSCKVIKVMHCVMAKSLLGHKTYVFFSLERQNDKNAVLGTFWLLGWMFLVQTIN